MDDSKARTALEQDLRRLEARVEELITVTARLREENRSLLDSQEQLATERANLLARNEQVRIRVEAMIHRLRALEQNA
jgi:cell division protein ZapB